MDGGKEGYSLINTLSPKKIKKKLLFVQNKYTTTILLNNLNFSFIFFFYFEFF